MKQDFNLASPGVTISYISLKEFISFCTNSTNKNNSTSSNKFINSHGEPVLTSSNLIEFIRSPFETVFREDPISKSEILHFLHNYEIKSSMSPQLNKEHKIQAFLFKKNTPSSGKNVSDFIISYRGSNNLSDLSNDFKISANITPKTFEQALTFYQTAKLENSISPDNISFYGHASGADLALWTKIMSNDGQVTAINPRTNFSFSSPSILGQEKNINIIIHNLKTSNESSHNFDQTSIPDKIKITNIHSPRNSISLEEATTIKELSYSLQLYKILANKFSTSIETIADLVDEFSLKTSIVLLSEVDSKLGIDLRRTVKQHFNTLRVNDPEKLNTHSDTLDSLLEKHSIFFAQTIKNKNIVKNLISKTLSSLSKTIVYQKNNSKKI